MPIEVKIGCRFFAVEEVEKMRRNLFRLSDEQWQRIEPLQPPDVRGKERFDERHGPPVKASAAIRLDGLERLRGKAQMTI